MPVEPDRAGSVPPPNWRGPTSQVSLPVVGASAQPAETPLASAPGAQGVWPGAFPSAPAVAGMSVAPDTDAAMSARAKAALIDGILVGVLYALLCLILGWRLLDPIHAAIENLALLAYYFGCEGLTAQTIGKRQYGLRVLSINGQAPTPAAILIRSLLRIIDILPSAYLIGLISMRVTGPERRQRLGDIAARTIVVSEAATSPPQRTPGWVLPALTGVALLLSVGAVVDVVTFRTRPLDAGQRADWIAGCERGAQGRLDCSCVLARLESAGYTTETKLASLAGEVRRAEEDDDVAEMPGALTSATLACR